MELKVFLIFILPSFCFSLTTQPKVVVHLFEWAWRDVADECERYLGPEGFEGIQLSPPQESVDVLIDGDIKPFWQRYQSVSYKLDSLSGNETEFQDMVERCNAANVSIYPEVLINHMSGDWPAGTATTGSSTFDYTNYDYPGVPYTSADFNTLTNCPTSSGNIESQTSAEEMHNCQLYGLRDLDQSKDNVRQQIITYLNKLIDMGVGGFYVDSVVYMSPQNLEVIYNSLNDLNTAYYPEGTRPFIFQQVLDLGGDPVSTDDYNHLGLVTEYRYSTNIGEVFRKKRSQALVHMKAFGPMRGFITPENALVFVDEHDNQRGHGPATGVQILNYKDEEYPLAVGFTLAWNYGKVRVMSSFEFNNTDIGPPMNGNTISPPIIEADGQCSGGWVCEHRWRSVKNMVKFKQAVGESAVVNWWDNGANQIAFGRDGAGFIAINIEEVAMSEVLQTGLASGRYCDVVTGDLEGGLCTGTVVQVDSSGNAAIDVQSASFLAIHINAMEG